jgi:hypothetical protein
MPERILYYLGAGASVQALPLAKSIYNKKDAVVPETPIVNGLAYSLKKIDINSIFRGLDESKYSDFKIEMQNNLTELSIKANEFGDVDTYAKYLHLKQDSSFFKLKKTLSQFFTIEQLLLNKLDGRYLPWLINIMDEESFPENVKILSWNYDFQVELAAKNFGDIENVEFDTNSFSYSKSFINHYPCLDPTPDRDNNFSIIHLNGIAGFKQPKDLYTSSIFQKSIGNNSISILNYLMKDDSDPQIHFAWEGSKYHKLLMKKVIEMIKGTTIVVIIGYSFPFFNRQIDKLVFEELMNRTPIKKIYYQDPKLSGEQLRAQFSLPQNLPIVHIKKVDNFHVPFEY